MRIFVLLLLSCLLLNAVTWAEDQTYSVCFTTLAWDRIDEPLYFQTLDGSLSKILMGTRARSPVYQYVGPSPLVFYTKTTGEQDEAQRTPVASYGISQSADELLLIFVQSPDGERLSVYGLDDSKESFPWGSVRFFNMTNSTLGVIYDDEKLRLDPKSFKTSKPKADRKRVSMAILTIRDDQLRDIYNAQWGQDSLSRNLIFIRPTNKRRNGVETKTIPEFAPIEASALQ